MPAYKPTHTFTPESCSILERQIRREWERKRKHIYKCAWERKAVFVYTIYGECLCSAKHMYLKSECTTICRNVMWAVLPKCNLFRMSSTRKFVSCIRCYYKGPKCSLRLLLKLFVLFNPWSSLRLDTITQDKSTFSSNLDQQFLTLS